MRKIVQFAIIYMSVSNLTSYAQSNIVSLAKDTLKIHSTHRNSFEKKQAVEQFADIKEFIQSDLLSGNPSARVDIFLLLDGLIENNLLSLQSYLATADNRVFSKEFAGNINYAYAEKLAYALKENKNLLKTEYVYDTDNTHGSCENYINGFKINQNSSFFGPAGLPYYVATYCSDKTYAIQKIKGEPAQARFNIHFSNYKTLDSNKFLSTPNTIPLSVPDKDLNSMDAYSPLQPLKESLQKESLPELSQNNSQNDLSFSTQTSSNSKESLQSIAPNFSISTAIGYSHNSGSLTTKSISNFNQSSGTIITSNTSIEFKKWFVEFDAAPIQQKVSETKQNIYTNGQGQALIDTKVSHLTQNGFFIRTLLGYHENVYEFNSKTSLSISPILSLTTIQTQGVSPYSNHFLGLGALSQIEYTITNQWNASLGVTLLAEKDADSIALATGTQLGLGLNW